MCIYVSGGKCERAFANWLRVKALAQCVEKRLTVSACIYIWQPFNNSFMNNFVYLADVHDEMKNDQNQDLFL